MAEPVSVRDVPDSPEEQAGPSAPPSASLFEVEISTGNRAQDRPRVSSAESPKLSVPTPLSLKRRARIVFRRRLFATLGFVLAFSTLIWGTAVWWQPWFEGNIVARVNGEPLSYDQVDREIKLSKALSSAATGKEQSPAPPSMLEQLIVIKLKAQAARRANFSVTPQDVDQAIDAVMQRADIAPEKLNAALHSYGLTRDDLRASFNDVVLADQFAAQYVVSGVSDQKSRLDKLNKWQTDLVQMGKVERLKSPTSGTAPRVGSEAPDFSVKDLDGKKISLSSLRGKPVVLNVWAPWCPPCRAEMPNLQAVYKSQGSAAGGFELLAFATQSDLSTVTAFVKEFGVTFPVLMDAENTVTDLYQVGPIPTSYFIDKDGIVRAVQIGQMDAATFQQRVDSAR